MKRLYETTNKRGAEPQIAKRVRRLERANLALDAKRRLQNQQQLEAAEREKRKKQEENAEEEEATTEGDSELRYHISASKNSPQDIFSMIRNNRSDPAYHVSPRIHMFLHILANEISGRIFYQSLKTIY